MSDELMNRARGLLALRDKATPGPWSTGLHGGGHDAPWLIRPAVAYQIDSDADAALIRSAHDMADTIRDLLAEVERQANNADNSALEAADMRARAEAAEQREAVLSAAEVKIDGHRFACSQAVADHVARLDADRVAAEARLRELASAEPGYTLDEIATACCDAEVPDSKFESIAISLKSTRRPEMPS